MTCRDIPYHQNVHVELGLQETSPHFPTHQTHVHQLRTIILISSASEGLNLASKPQHTGLTKILSLAYSHLPLYIVHRTDEVVALAYRRQQLHHMLHNDLYRRHHPAFLA